MNYTGGILTQLMCRQSLLSASNKECRLIKALIVSFNLLRHSGKTKQLYQLIRLLPQ